TQPILQTSLDLCLENNFKPTFSKINRMIMPAVSALQLGGLDVRNQSDRVKQRLSEFQKTENIFDGLSHYPVQGFWDTEDIVLNLMQEPNSYIYQTVITDLLTTMQRLYEHNEAKNDLRTLVVIDECGSVFPLTGKDIDTDRFMERLIKSCRACGIGRINITQQPHKVADYVPDNSAYFLTFPIAGTAIDPIKKYIMLSDEQVSHIQKLEKYGEGIFRDRRFDRPYIIQVPPYLDDSPILRSEVNAMMQPYIENLIQKYTQKPEPVRAKSEIYSEAQLEYYRKKIWSHTRAVLEKLYSEPFLNHTKIQTVMDISRSKFKKSIEWLEGHRLLKTIKCKTSKTREATFYPLTVDGFRLLEIPEKDRKNGAHMFKHDYYKMRLFECLKAMKLSPAMEYLPDNLKTMGAHGRIDVYCKSKKGKQYANEITLSFSNLIDNVKKCDLADMDVISIICEDQAGIDKAKAKIEDAHIRTRAEIKYKKINEYL
ncbi:hypothetical protein KA005_42360, partial [bacterium]|nr:hypothetical protein [bacterium]